METISTEVVVLGGGVIGLAVGQALSQQASVILLEKNPKFGQETSSRNSEVIHSGIYYPKESLKTKLCIDGRDLLYEFCSAHKVPFRKSGKYIVGSSKADLEYLEKIFQHAKDLGVPIEKKSGRTISTDEPLVKTELGLFCPETGVINSHVFMEKLEAVFQKQEGLLCYRHEVTHIERKNNGFAVTVKNSDSSFVVLCDVLVNAAGLLAPEFSNSVLQTKKYEHRFCRGRYFVLSHSYKDAFKKLVYPTPVKDGLGVHVTLDMDGYARLGPDTDWCATPLDKDFTSLYDCDWDALKPEFHSAAKRYLPSVQLKDLSPGLIGIRPKLFIQGQATPDFLVENHDHFIHCLGIESPGLTASLAIAKKVRSFL